MSLTQFYDYETGEFRDAGEMYEEIVTAYNETSESLRAIVAAYLPRCQCKRTATCRGITRHAESANVCDDPACLEGMLGLHDLPCADKIRSLQKADMLDE